AIVLIDGFKGTSYIDIINELCPMLKDSEPGKLDHPTLPRLKTIIYAGEEECPAGMVNWNDLYILAEKTPYDEFKALSDRCDCHEIVNIQYTSGTTGFPKGVMLSHYNILNNGHTIGDGMKLTHEDKLCITVPFFHCFGMVLALMSCITHGTPFVPIDMFSPEKVMYALQNEGCTAVHGVPTMFIAMMDNPNFSKYDFSKMRTGIMAGSPCPIKTMREVITKMNMKDIVIVFGQTEASPGCTMTRTNDTEEHRCTTVGKAFPGVECKIVDPETGEKLPVGEIGEFCAKGYNIMKGYYKMPEATALAIDKDGWLHFGDLAMCDEEGYYKVTGRLKDMIIRGGENIYPKELEECLYNHPDVKDVQVIGIPSKKYGEEVCACVILREDSKVTEEDIREYYKQMVAFFKIPKKVWFLDEFPMTSSGKIQKFILRDQAIEHFALQADSAIETA
ncbi:MAG: AMP-binding protein, partial [Oscillospiraceae bacterium]